MGYWETAAMTVCYSEPHGSASGHRRRRPNAVLVGRVVEGPDEGT